MAGPEILEVDCDLVNFNIINLLLFSFLQIWRLIYNFFQKIWGPEANV